MRLKVLFAPAAIALAIVLLIWFVWPAFEDLNNVNQDLKSKQESLNNLMSIKDNVQALKKNLDQNLDKENFVLSYLPVQRDEENIVNSINFLAASDQLNLTNVNIEKEQIATGSTVDASQTTPDDTGNASGTADKNIQYMQAKIDISGNYDSIVRFVNSINKMEFLDKVDSMEISAPTNNQPQQPAQQQPQQPPAQSLTGSLTVDFGYLAPISAGNNFSSPVFSRSSFDFSKVDAVTSAISEKAPALDEGAKGMTNPFFH